MIRLDTLRAAHERDHTLAAYCPTCRRWAVLNLGRLRLLSVAARITRTM